MFRFRPGVDGQEQLRELENTLSLENLTDTEIKTEFPEAGSQKLNWSVVEDTGILYLVVTAKGLRHRIPFTAF
jgi:hypothetical protein